MTENNDSSLLTARIDDLLRQSDKGCVTHTGFLNLHEQYLATQYVKHSNAEERLFLYGGYADAERKCLFFVPEFFLSYADCADISSVLPYCVDEVTAVCQAVKISGSGFRKLSHRDYMGAILNLGIERDVLGDICVTDDYSCVIFASQTVASFLCTTCERIGQDKVKVRIADLSEGFNFERKTKEITDTVASERLDCVISSLTNESREKTKEAILNGSVECNFEVCDRTDRRVCSGDTVSVRGFGRFVIDGIDEATKKGRLRLHARKYI